MFPSFVNINTSTVVSQKFIHRVGGAMGLVRMAKRANCVSIPSLLPADRTLLKMLSIQLEMSKILLAL